MFQFIDRWKLELKHHMEIRRLRKHRDIELRDIKQKKQFEINKTELEREIELEELKAEIRKNQQKSLPKPGQKIPEKKTAFAAFQDYATNFAQNQQKSSSAFGNMSGGLVSSYDKPEPRRDKKKDKKKRKMDKRKEVKMIYVPMNQFGNKY